LELEVPSSDSGSKKTIMKKLTYVLSALATFAVVARTIGSAGEVGIRVGGNG
jgi:hypothetical protein